MHPARRLGAGPSNRSLIGNGKDIILNFQHPLLRLVALVGLTASLAAPALAVEVEAARDDSYQQLVQGELRSMALTSDGFLVPSYDRRPAGDTRNEIVWDALREPSGAVLAATGHHGKLVRLVDAKTTKTVASLPEPELTALTRLHDGSVLVAAAPTGRIYRLSADDKLTTYTQLKAKFIWRLVPDSDGSVWAVTGAEGRLFRIRDNDGSAQVQEVAKFKSANLLDLWIDRDGLLGVKGDVYVAGQNPGWLYRYRPSTGKTEVAYNAQAEEIRRLLPLRDGLALALNTERSPSPQALSLTLRMSGGPGGGPLSGAPGAPMGGPGSTTSDPSLSQAFAPGAQGGFGLPRSEVVILDKSGFVRNLWQSPDRPIHDLAISPEHKILAAAGNQGRLFEINPLGGEYSVIADVREDYLMRIVADDQGYLLTAARNGLVFAMTRERADDAVYVSRPVDAGKLVKWGHTYFNGDLADGQEARLSFRVGNDGDADSAFWSDWSPEVTVRPHQAIELPAGPTRFLQYRLTLRQGSGQQAPPRMEYLDLFYIARNAAPKVLSVLATEASSMARSSSPSTSTGDGSNNSSGGSAPAVNLGAAQNPGGSRSPRSNGMSFSISWRVLDSNGDALRYAVYFKAADEKEWKEVDKDLTSTQLPLSVAGLADGRYRFRVVASDELANPPGEGLKGEAISNEILVDNTPPVVENKTFKVEGKQALITFDAADNISLLSSVRVDVDNGFDTPVLPVDGVTDQSRESYSWRTKMLKPGEHVATIAVTDARGNTTVEKVVFTIPK